MQQINWFSPRELLTYNCIYNFVVGDRGGGKSFGTLRFVIDRFKKTGEQFIYLRRYDTELQESLPKLFVSVKKEGYYPKDELKVSGNNLYCNGKIMGYGVPLSTSMKKKSIPFDNVKWIIFEEFMVDGRGSRYIGPGESEVDLFLNFFESVQRMRDVTKKELVRVIFIANAFSMVNIYFTYFKIRMKPPYKKYTKFGDILICMWQDESYREAKKKSRFYKLVEGTAYASHAYENKFIMDSDHFIKKRPPSAEFHFGLTYMGKTYGVWADWDKGYFYITNKTGSMNQNNVFSLTLDDNRPNNINIRRVRNMPFILGFRRAVDENRVYYDNLETFANINEAVYLLRTIT